MSSKSPKPPRVAGHAAWILLTGAMALPAAAHAADEEVESEAALEELESVDEMRRGRLEQAHKEEQIKHRHTVDEGAERSSGDGDVEASDEDDEELQTIERRVDPRQELQRDRQRNQQEQARKAQ